MGWLMWATGQVIGTTLVLGSMKRHGVIVVHPQSFKNETTRVVFTRMISIGEDLTVVLEQLYGSAYEKIMKR